MACARTQCGNDSFLSWLLTPLPCCRRRGGTLGGCVWCCLSAVGSRRQFCRRAHARIRPYLLDAEDEAGGRASLCDSSALENTQRPLGGRPAPRVPLPSSAWGKRCGQRGAGLLLMDATWLILPVVICLSQRLSHACVSMNEFTL